MKKTSTTIHYGMVALHGVGGFFVLTFFLSLFVYIYLHQLVHQQFNTGTYGWIRMFVLPLIGLSLGSLFSYVIISIKRLSLEHTFFATGIALGLYYGDYYFGSFLHRKYTNALYQLLEKPSMEAVLIGYIVLTLLLGLACYYCSYRIKTKGAFALPKSQTDLLDDGMDWQ